MQCITFDDLLNSPDKKFLKLFTPTFTSSSQQEDSSPSGQGDKTKTMSRIPQSGSKPGSGISRLAQPGSLSKRPREGSLDLETGLDAKKSKVDSLSVPTTNLTKSKSKSMMSIAGKANYHDLKSYILILTSLFRRISSFQQAEDTAHHGQTKSCSAQV